MNPRHDCDKGIIKVENHVLLHIGYVYNRHRNMLY